jgi:hypothetical protein
MEATVQSSQGKLAGQDVTTTGTYWQTIREGGVLYGEGRVVFITADGEVAEWSGFGVGRPTGPVPAASYATCGVARTRSQRLARINNIATVGEYEVDQNGKFTWKLHEWAPAGALAGAR